MNRNGEVYACGSNEFNQVGIDNDYNSVFQPEKIKVLSNDNKMIACGANHSLVLKNNGEVWGFGHNTSGCLGIPPIDGNKNILPNYIRQFGNCNSTIVGGHDVTAVIKNNGRIFALGKLPNGQFAIPQEIGEKTPYNKLISFSGDENNFYIVNQGNKVTSSVQTIPSDIKYVATSMWNRDIILVKNNGSLIPIF